MLIYLSKCHDATRVAKEQDLGTRSGCHSNMPEIKAVLFFNFFIYLLTFLFVSVVSFRSFHFVVLGFSTCLCFDMKHEGILESTKEGQDNTPQRSRVLSVS